MTKSHGRNRPETGRRAAIVDLENLAIVGGDRLRPSDLREVVAFVETQIVDVPVRVATGRIMLRSFMPILGETQWGLTVVRTEPDAADHALIEAADEFIRCGVTDIVVAGGDGAYVSLAAHARLHVISHATHLSNALRLAATTVTYLPHVIAPVNAAI